MSIKICPKDAVTILHFFLPVGLSSYSLVRIGGRIYFCSGTAYTFRIYHVENEETSLVSSNLDERRIFLLLHKLSGADLNINGDAIECPFNYHGCKSTPTLGNPTVVGLRYRFNYYLSKDTLSYDANHGSAQELGNHGFDSSSSTDASFFDYSTNLLEAHADCFWEILKSNISSNSLHPKESYLFEQLKKTANVSCSKHKFIELEETCSASTEEIIGGSFLGGIPKFSPKYWESGVLVIQSANMDRDSIVHAGAKLEEGGQMNLYVDLPQSIPSNSSNSDGRGSRNGKDSTTAYVEKALSIASELQRQICLYTLCGGHEPRNYYKKLREDFLARTHNASWKSNSTNTERLDFEKYLEHFERLLGENL